MAELPSVQHRTSSGHDHIMSASFRDLLRSGSNRGVNINTLDSCRSLTILTSSPGSTSADIQIGRSSCGVRVYVSVVAV